MDRNVYCRTIICFGVCSFTLWGSLIGFETSSYAGMPSVLPERWEGTPRLTEITAHRLQAISFFAVGLVICSFAVQQLWNVIAANSVWLPKLSFGKAFVLILLWGSLFVIVLTMISGARELLTPGAWKQEGMIYKLNTTDAEQGGSNEAN